MTMVMADKMPKDMMMMRHVNGQTPKKVAMEIYTTSRLLTTMEPTGLDRFYSTGRLRVHTGLCIRRRIEPQVWLVREPLPQAGGAQA